MVIMSKNLIYGNLFGVLAILFWSFLSVLPILAGDIPNMLLLALSLTISVLVFIPYWVVKYRSLSSLVKQVNFEYLIVSALLLAATEITFLCAMRAGDPIAAYISVNIWPTFMLLFSYLFLGHKLSGMHYVSGLFGAIGVIILAMSSVEAPSVDIDQNLGSSLFAILFGLANAVLWSIYSIWNRKFSLVPVDSVGLPLIICMLNAYIIHFLIEAPYDLSNISYEQISALLILGALPWGAAYVLWGYAMRFGDIKFISLLGYTMPVLGSIWIALFGYSSIQFNTVIALIIITFGSLLSVFAKKQES